jgi:phosphatidylinositol alpha-mannosyltransferase
MKIGIVSPYDWSHHGGVNTHIARLATEFRRRGHSVRILAAASGSKGREVEYGMYRIGWTASVPFNGSIARIALTTAVSRAIRHLLRQEQFDVIHLHEPLVSTLTLTTLRLAREEQIPCVGTFHASSSRRRSTASMVYAMASPILQSSFYRLNSVIAVSDTAYNHVSRFFPANYHIIPNGIDLDTFTGPFERLPQFNDGKFNILFLSRLESRKGLRYLLKAIPAVQRYTTSMNFPPVRFIIVGKGNGSQQEKYEQFVQRQGWPDVIFTGGIDESVKPFYYASADVYCAPSTGNESQGITLLEAMASSVPVIASDIAGYRTVIQDPSMGLLVPPRNASQLAEAICQLLVHPHLREALARNGYQRAKEYDWKGVASEIEEVYKEACKSNTSLKRKARRFWFSRHRKRISVELPPESSDITLGSAKTSG